MIQRLGRVLRLEDSKMQPLIIIPVSRGTWEDPLIQGNERLQHSSLNLIVEQAKQVQIVEVSDTEQISKVLRQHLPIQHGETIGKIIDAA